MVARKRMGRPVLFAFLPLLVLLLISAAPPARHLVTNACGPIAGDTTWTLAASPYVVTCDVTVNGGVTLTVQPGVVVKFQTQSCDLIVDGRLMAQGGEGNPIVFTSYRDDAHGGDTNGDGSATSPTPNDWGGVVLTASSSGSVLDHTWIGYGGYGGSPYSYANLHLYTSDATVQNSTIAYSSHRGLHVGGVDPAHPLVLTNNTFLNNAEWAVWDDTTGTRTDITLAGNTSTGPANNGYGLKGSVAGTVTFSSADDLPFIVWDSWTNLSVDAGATLTFGPGTVVKFQSNRALLVDGTLLAQGGDTDPVVFTSYRDDAHGGDTNGDGGATSPAPNDWSGIGLSASSSGSVLDHTWIGYGGYGGSPYSYANLHLYTSDATVQNSTLAYSSHRGLHVGGVDPAHPLVLTNNAFLNNAEWAVYDDATGTLSDITLVGNTSSGSPYNGFGLMGAVAGTVTYSSPADFPFIVLSDVTVGTGSSLTFAAGTVVKFEGWYDDLIVNGRLAAQGTEAEPVVFTSLPDDAHGGDTNGNGSATGPVPGDWGGIQVAGDAALDGASLLYAGYAGNAALRVQSGGKADFADGLVRDSKNLALGVSGTGWLRVSGSRIEHNQGSALVVDGDTAWVHITGSSLVGNGVVGNPAGGVRNNGKATVVLGGEPGAGNEIQANAGYGAYQAGTGATMLATYNWWGDASGPQHPTLNPGGQGEEVSDRVAFAPWLSEADALPAEGLVELVAPLSFSPGETLNLGVRFGNVLSETLQDAVVVAQLPEPGAYVLSTAGGRYRPETHDVVWRLGDVAPGERLDALVRIEAAWGLPAHSYTGARALVAASNLPNPAVDLGEVLGYTPVVTVSQHYLTPAELAAELAADAELRALFQQAQALGYVSYEIVLSETFDSGAELLTLGLLDRERMEDVVYVQRLGEQRTILRMTSAYATQYNDAGGWRYDYDTGEWSYWGDWGPAVGGAQALDRIQEKSMQTCMRNGLIRNFGGFMDYVRRLEQDMAKQLLHPCFTCRYEGTACKECLRAMFGRVAHAYAREAAAQRVAWMLDRCTESKDAFDCSEDFRTCWHDPGRVEYNFVRWETCNPFTGDFTGEKQYLSCGLGQPCVKGCCTGTTGAASGCFAGSGGVSGTTCACETGLCSVQELEIRTAQDPNAKLGPAEAAAGEWLSYTVQYENVGAGTAYGVYVEDPLSPLVDDNSLQIEDGGLYFSASRTLYWPVGELAPGAGGSLDFRVQVPTDAISGTALINGATVYFPSVPETTPTGDVVTLVQDLVAHSQRVETGEGVPVEITLTGHSPAGPLTYQIVARAGSGTLSGTLPKVTYSPAPNFEGPDRFTFRVSDGVRQSWPAEVRIVVHTGAETLPPEVYATSPTPGETGVQVSATPVYSDTYSPSVRVSFSEPIDAATVTAASLFVADAQGRHLAGYTVYDAGAYAARFVPREPFQPAATYTATVTTAVHDTSGNALAERYEWSFRTEAAPAAWAYLPLVLRGR